MLPLPTALSTQICPPIMATSCDEIVSPRAGATVQRRRRSVHDLDTLDGLHVDAELRTEVRAAVDVVTLRMPVHQEDDLLAVVASLGKGPHTDVAVPAGQPCRMRLALQNAS